MNKYITISHYPVDNKLYGTTTSHEKELKIGIDRYKKQFDEAWRTLGSK